MNARATVLYIMITACLLVTPGYATTYKSTDGTLTLNARTIEGTESKLVAMGKAHVHSSDPVAKTTLEADAEKIVVILGTAKDKKAAKGVVAGTSISRADLSGPVKMVYMFHDTNGGLAKVTATADNADFDGATNLAHLVGDVKIVSENPSLFSEPAVMAGDKATVNLTPNPGPDAFRFRVESSPGVSSITVTPKVKDSNQ